MFQGHGLSQSTQIRAHGARALYDGGGDRRLFRRQRLYRQVWAERTAGTRSGDNRADVGTGAAEAGARGGRAARLPAAIRPGRPGHARRTRTLSARLRQPARSGSDGPAELIVKFQNPPKSVSKMSRCIALRHCKIPPASRNPFMAVLIWRYMKHLSLAWNCLGCTEE